MHGHILMPIALALAIGICSLTARAARTGKATIKAVRDMVLAPDGFVHVAEDGIARSYAGNGTFIDYAPLINEQLTNMVKSLPIASDGEREHLTKPFATVNGFAVKDLHQIFHPSTQLRPAINPARTHWQKDITAARANDSNFIPVDRHEGCTLTPCSTGLHCVAMGCDVCIIANDMSTRFCHHGDY